MAHTFPYNEIVLKRLAERQMVLLRCRNAMQHAAHYVFFDVYLKALQVGRPYSIPQNIDEIIALPIINQNLPLVEQINCRDWYDSMQEIFPLKPTMVKQFMECSFFFAWKRYFIDQWESEWELKNTPIMCNNLHQEMNSLQSLNKQPEIDVGQSTLAQIVKNIAKLKKFIEEYSDGQIMTREYRSQAKELKNELFVLTNSMTKEQHEEYQTQIDKLEEELQTKQEVLTVQIDFLLKRMARMKKEELGRKEISIDDSQAASIMKYRGKIAALEVLDEELLFSVLSQALLKHPFIDLLNNKDHEQNMPAPQSLDIPPPPFEPTSSFLAPGSR